MSTNNANIGSSNNATSYTITSSGTGYSGGSTIAVGGGGGGSGGIANTNFISNSIGNGNSTFSYTYPSMTVNKLTVDGIDISNFMQNIASRLAILEEPNPEKLEQFNALKKAYDHYKLLEKLFNDDSKGTK